MSDERESKVSDYTSYLICDHKTQIDFYESGKWIATYYKSSQRLVQVQDKEELLLNNWLKKVQAVVGLAEVHNIVAMMEKADAAKSKTI